PPCNRLTPPPRVPAHTDPSRFRCTAYTLPAASPFAAVYVSDENESLVGRRRVSPPRCLPAHNSPAPPSMEYTTSLSRSRPSKRSAPVPPSCASPPLACPTHPRPGASTNTGPAPSTAPPRVME